MERHLILRCGGCEYFTKLADKDMQCDKSAVVNPTAFSYCDYYCPSSDTIFELQMLINRRLK